MFFVRMFSLNKKEFKLLYFILFIYLMVPQYALSKPCKGYSVTLTSMGSSKIQVVKAVGELTGLRFIAARKIVESAPSELNTKLSREKAERYKQHIEKAGGEARVDCMSEDVGKQNRMVTVRSESLDSPDKSSVLRSQHVRVDPDREPGPSLGTVTEPDHPTNIEKVKFIASASHANGVKDITIYVEGKKVHTCQGSHCDYTGGPFKTGSVSWNISARSKNGTETIGTVQHVMIKEAPAFGQCSISGKVTGSYAAVAPVFFINLFGPNNDQYFRETTGFKANGRYKFDKLPPGKYRMTVNTHTNLTVTAHPVSQIVNCQGSGSQNVNYDFR